MLKIEKFVYSKRCPCVCDKGEIVGDEIEQHPFLSSVLGVFNEI
jgi:hypothetical protein